MQETDLYQEAEPVVAGGVAAALQMANKKGFVEHEEGGERKRDGSRVIVHGIRDRFMPVPISRSFDLDLLRLSTAHMSETERERGSVTSESV